MQNNIVTIKQNGRTLIYNQINQATQVYYLSSVTDNFSNEIIYNYFVDENYVYLSSIEYSNVAVKFSYEPRNDEVYGFNQVPFIVKKKLVSVDIKKNEALVHSYKLSYRRLDTKSHLDNITMENQTGEQKPPIQFQWETTINDAAENVKVINFPNSDKYKFEDLMCVPGDFDNDAIDDIAFVDNNAVHFYKGSRDGAFTFYSDVEISNDKDYKIQDVLKHLVLTQLFADTDGDGTKELVLISKPHLADNNGARNKPFEVTVSYCNPIHKEKNIFKFQLSTTEMPAFTIGDFYGTGQALVLLADKNKSDNDRYYFWATAHGFQLLLPGKPCFITNGDFDGDGLLDLLVVSEKVSTVYWNKGTRSGSIFADDAKTEVQNVSANCAIVRTGDFDGDGKHEILYNTAGTPSFNIVKNTGNRNFSVKNAAILSNVYDLTDSQKDDDKFGVEVTDFNCDGRDDILISKAKFEHPSKKSYYRHSKSYDYWMSSYAYGFSEHKSITWDDEANPLCYQFFTGDFNGDGYQEIMQFHRDGKWYMYSPFGSKSQSNNFEKITKITNNGSYTSITYGNLTDPKLYSKFGTKKYPMVEVTYALPVVSSVTQSNGIAPLTTANYIYKYLMTHLKGKGILGFDYREVRYPNLSSSTVTMINSWNTDFYIPESIKTTHFDESSTYEEVVMAIEKISDNRYFAYPSVITETDRYGKNTITENTYNANWFLDTKKTIYPDESYKLEKYQNYVIAGGCYLPQQIISEQKHCDDSQTFIMQKHFD
ncbi:MAG: VCBS repeat-containing protein, partial [Bacteroidales bacterium]|nr:VCBS repeat-containing protein [Bacteroidales bacterium]